MVTFSVKNGMAVKQEQRDDTVAGMFTCLMHSSTVTQIMHRQTESYAAHVALGEYYEGIISLVDKLAEAYQGRNQVIIGGYPLPENNWEDKSPLDYMMYVRDEMAEYRKLLGDDSTLQNIADEIVALIYSTMYKLRFLK